MEKIFAIFFERGMVYVIAKNFEEAFDKIKPKKESLKNKLGCLCMLDISPVADTEEKEKIPLLIE